MNFKQCLQQTRYWELMIIARERNVSLGANKRPKKSVLVELLFSALRDEKSIQRALRGLSGEERAALDALIVAEGRMETQKFTAQFGEIRDHKPSRADAPEHPEWAPASPAERLAHLGLIFRPLRKLPQKMEVLIPTDLYSVLPKVKLPSQDTGTVGYPRGNPLLTDATLFLSLLNREDIRPLHKRWLSLNQVKALNERFTVKEDLSQVRSELQCKRLVFLHFLAETAGFVDQLSEFLKPSLIGWQWLKGQFDEQLRSLWECYQKAENELWKRYQLPGHEQDEPVELVVSLSHHLSSLKAGAVVDIEVFAKQVAKQDAVFWNLQTTWEEMKAGQNQAAERFIKEMITGPCQWWGIVTLDESNFMLTPLGYWLLNGGEAIQISQSKLIVDSGLNVTVAESVSGQNKVYIEALASFSGCPDGHRQYQITPASLAKGLRRGLDGTKVVHDISEMTIGGLTDGQRGLLKKWMSEIERVKVVRLTLLETSSHALMSRITKERSLRQHLGRTLSGRVVVVKEGAVGRLQRALLKQDINVAGIPTQGRKISLDKEALLLLSVKVYEALRQWCQLPFEIPSALVKQLTAHHSLKTLTIVEQAVEEISQQLKSVIDGWAILPSESGLPPEETLPVILEAIEKGQKLEMTYWTAGRGVRTHRVISPYRVEWRNRIAYLHAFCHSAYAERCFRVDRIEQVEMVG